jgi:purine-binding chemotaxis protein CheW
MVNLRGNMIPLLNLRTLFGLENKEIEETSKLLVVEYGNSTLGIIIDSASEVMDISDNLLEEISSALIENQGSGYISSIAKINGGTRIVSLLNLASVFSFL